MQLTPRYEGSPLIVIDGPPAGQRQPFLRQRRRLERSLSELTDEQWQHATRCDGWSVQDVVAHLIGTNQFWHASITAGLDGTPTRMLTRFDPAATPALMVAQMRSMTSVETLAEFCRTNEALYDTIESLDDAGWEAIGEAPPGHLPVRLLTQHALWDSWVHERDIFLPLGHTPAEEDDEIISCLTYVAALGPGLIITTTSELPAVLVIDATEPNIHLVVDVGTFVSVSRGAAPVGAAVLVGRALDLVEMLSIRAPLGADLSPVGRRLAGALGRAFDAPGWAP